MTRKPRTTSPSSRKPSKRALIPEPFRIFSSAIVEQNDTSFKVPMLVLCCEWLKTIGFPIGSAAYLICDEQGELALQRVGLRRPRRLTIRTTPR